MDGHYLGRMCRHAVDRSEGGLVEIRMNIGSDSLLEYIADRFSLVLVIFETQQKRLCNFLF